jgi:hypothetical protein
VNALYRIVALEELAVRSLRKYLFGKLIRHAAGAELRTLGVSIQKAVAKSGSGLIVKTRC